MAILKNTKIAINFTQIFDQPSGGAIKWPNFCEILEVQLFELHNYLVNPIYKWPKIPTVMFWKGKICISNEILTNSDVTNTYVGNNSIVILE